MWCNVRWELQLYSDLGNPVWVQNKGRRYGEEVIQLSLKYFHTYAVQICNKVKGSGGERSARLNSSNTAQSPSAY